MNGATLSLKRLFAAACVALTAVTTTVVLTASPAAAAVSDGAVFNNPLVAAEQYKIRDHVRTLIDGSPAGSTIRIAMYNFTDTVISGALISAKDRGVNVRLVVNYDTSTSAAVTSLKTALGTDRTQASWVSVCTSGGACIGSAGTPIMHNKFYLFSSTNGSSNVVVQSSANLTVSNATVYWNNAVTLVGNAGLYNAYADYHSDLAAKVKNSNYYTSVLSGNAKVYFFPRAGTDETTDTIYNMLNENITCEGNTTTGTSDLHRTIIRVGMWYFSRDDIARRLKELANEKCWVDVIYTEADAGVLGQLRGNSRIAVYQVPENPNIIHSKYLAIEGTYIDQKDTKWVITGSHNYSNAALRENDEAMIRIKSDAIFDQYRANFRTVRANAVPDPNSAAS
ncbi:phosphatidylserine/phosphatidylglycerophosphate/cardiolipin synthase family protein [Actinoplanes sp. NPDC051494]|uniref:phosphatidylserine/phosphatidylglycerophosphate/ cardiolipin synthase family protein n=1 Tax=Actinoplanes sp. NPDC051494 TaxID=3363907 RepID=UPI0037A9B654